jgi:hypothetical protein
MKAKRKIVFHVRYANSVILGVATGAAARMAVYLVSLWHSMNSILAPIYAQPNKPRLADGASHTLLCPSVCMNTHWYANCLGRCYYPELRYASAGSLLPISLPSKFANNSSICSSCQVAVGTGTMKFCSFSWTSYLADKV